MKPEDFNSELREIILNLISDGYLKYDITSITLGPQRMHSINRFCEGRDMGVKPLTSFLDALDFDLYLVAIPKDSIEDKTYIESFSRDALETIALTLNEYLENTMYIKGKKKSQEFIIDTVFNEFIKKLKTSDLTTFLDGDVFK